MMAEQIKMQSEKPIAAPQAAIPMGYKRTEVGVIPEDWETSLLGALAEKIMVGIASAATHAYCKTGIPLLRNQNIKPNKLDFDDLLFINEAYEATFKNKRLKAGDLLTARTGYPGTTCIISDDFENAQSFTTLITRPTNKVNSKFLSIFMNSEIGVDFFDKNQIGGGQKNINAATLRTFIVAIPDLEEQTAIANVLSDTDTLITALEQLIAKKHAIKTGTMQQLLTGRTRLPKFALHPDGTPKGYKSTELGQIPEDWEVRNVGHVCDLLTGFPFPSNKYSDSGIRLLRGSNVKRGLTDWSEEITQYWPEISADIKQYELCSGDIVVSMDGSLVGKSFAQLSEGDLPALLLQRVARIRSLLVSQSFLNKWICSPFFTEHCDSVKTVTAIPHISPQDIRDFKLLLPKTEKEQTAIATILSDMDKELAALAQKLAKARDIKQGMMQQLLTGRIRLPLAPQA